jgi:hypothetical protein
MKEYVTIVHGSQTSYHKNFGRNGNHTFFVSGYIGLCVNQGTGFLAEKVHAQRNVSVKFRFCTIQ